MVIHATATKAIDSPREWLCNPDSKVSAHYLIGRDGLILNLVDEKNIAYHAGESSWKGMAHVNRFSIGIELVNSNDGIMDYPDVQMNALVSLVVPICSDYGISPEDVIGHLDIAPGRKTDPAGFPWEIFRAAISAA